MKKITITSTCDSCGGTTKMVEDIPMAFGPAVPVTVDLCRACMGAIEASLQPIMDKGVRQGAAGRSGGRIRDRSITATGIRRSPCPDCGQMVAEGIGTSLHRRARHKDEDREMAG